MEIPPFEDVFPIKNGDIPASYISLPEGKPLLAGRAIVCMGFLQPGAAHRWNHPKMKRMHDAWSLGNLNEGRGVRWLIIWNPKLLLS